MPFFVYQTPQVKKDARKHSYEQQMAKFVRRLEETQNLALLDRFHKPYLTKQFEKQMRLIAELRIFGENGVICFLRLLVRGDAQYKAFQTSPAEYGSRNLQQLAKPDAVFRHLQERTATPPIPPPPPPSPEETAYLYAALSESADPYKDLVCCESLEWSKGLAQPGIRKRIATFSNAILEAALSDADALQHISIKGHSDLSFLCRNIPSLRKLLLIKPFCGKQNLDEALRELPPSSNLNAIMQAQTYELVDQDVLRETWRAYPAEILEDSGLWTDIEIEHEGNLALSFEEIGVLESVRGEGGFPLFINGRAGSGKSTILQYLFAEYAYHYLTQPPDGLPPMYFTCSMDLIRQAQQSVESLVNLRYKTLHRDERAETGNWKRHVEHTIGGCFREFHGFLLSLLSGNTLTSQFDASRRVDYGKFKQLWTTKFGKDPRAAALYGPDLSWHIIRSYVKGHGVENLLDPDDYQEIPGKLKTVTEDTYRLVYERVWTKWYRPLCAEDKYWDDQDLIRLLLETNGIEAKFPAVFCDESQDFTRIELEALYRLNLFSKRLISPNEIPRIPFAFAGDPFQTLNPTGFRWATTKAAFTEKFIENTVYGYHTSARGVNYCELSHNYRSSENIVRFCNTLQLFRRSVFDLTDVHPQESWRREGGAPMPSFFSKAEPKVLSRLREESEIRIIVPCEEGGEEAYVDADPELNSFIMRDEKGVPKNVMSPSRAKGQEFPRVVLYGFGEKCPPRLIEALKSPSSTIPEDEAIALQYFFNKLYVAASRPKRRLFIVDSAKGEEGLWAFVTNAELRKLFLASIPDANDWNGCIGGMVIGRDEDWDEDREDPAETAKILEQQGLRSADPFLLRQAAQSYEAAGNTIKMTECRALAFELEREFGQAADLYENLGYNESALDVLWKGGRAMYQRIKALAARQPAIQRTLQARIASFLTESQSFDEGLTLLTDLESQLDDEPFALGAAKVPSWRNALESIVDALRSKSSQEAGPQVWRVVYGTIERIGRKGLTISALLRGWLCYLAGMPAEAFKKWQDVPESNRPVAEYLTAQAAAAGYPESLLVYGDILARDALAGSHADAARNIVIAWEMEPAARLKPEHWIPILKALRFENDWGRAVDTAFHVSDTDELTRLVIALVGAEVEDSLILRATRQVTRALVAISAWERFRELWTGRIRLPGTPRDDAVRLSTDNIRPAMLEVLARSDTLANADVSVKNAVSERVWQWNKERGYERRDPAELVVVGAVLERAALYKDILAFYEELQSLSTLPDLTRRAAGLRWARTKWKQAAYEYRGGNRNAVRLAEEYSVDAQRKAAELGVADVESLPDYPSLDEDTVSVSAALGDLSQIPSIKPEIDVQTIEVPGFRIRVHLRKRRLNIEHLASMDAASVKLDTLEVTGDGNFVVSHDSPEIFRSKDWGVAINLSGLQNGRDGELELESGAKFTFKMQ